MPDPLDQTLDWLGASLSTLTRIPAMTPTLSAAIATTLDAAEISDLPLPTGHSGGVVAHWRDKRLWTFDVEHGAVTISFTGDDRAKLVRMFDLVRAFCADRADDEYADALAGVCEAIEGWRLSPEAVCNLIVDLPGELRRRAEDRAEADWADMQDPETIAGRQARAERDLIDTGRA